MTEGEAVPAADVDADTPAERLGVAEPVPVIVDVAVPVAAPVLVDVSVGVGVGVAEHRKRMFVDDAAVSGTVARVLLAASKMLIVLLTARVLQPPLMPAAVHAAGGTQHDSVIDARL